MWRKVMNYYNTNAKFHGLVIAVEYAGISFLTSWSGGVPTGKSGWVALGGGLIGAVVGAVKRWMATNVASVGVETKP